MESLQTWLTESAFLLPNWKWLALVVIAVAGSVADRVTAFALGTALRARVGDEAFAGALPPSGMRPFGILVGACVWSAGLYLLDLPAQVFVVLHAAVTLVGALAAVWGAWRLVDVLAAVLGARAAKTDTKFDDLLVPLVRRGLKVFVAAFGLVFVASNLDVDISSLLAGLGLGGLAFALAAQDTVRNLFGTATVITDRPFDVGDWVKVGDVEGTVESVGFRSTRVRTFYDSVVTVPNGELLSATVDNLGKRRYRRFKTVLSVTYDTPPERIEAFCEGIRELVRAHPYTRKDYFQVYLNAFSASSLDVLLYVFHECDDWSTELRERHRLMLDILRLAGELGVEFAFPTQTLYMQRGAAVARPLLPASDEAVRVAAREVAARSLAAGARPAPVAFGDASWPDRGEG